MALINHSCAPNSATMVLATSSSAEVAESLQLGGKAIQEPSPHQASMAKYGGESREEVNPGDLMMVVRAASALKAGEEVTIAYTGAKKVLINTPLILLSFHEASQDKNIGV